MHICDAHEIISVCFMGCVLSLEPTEYSGLQCLDMHTDQTGGWGVAAILQILVYAHFQSCWYSFTGLHEALCSPSPSSLPLCIHTILLLHQMTSPSALKLSIHPSLMLTLHLKCQTTFDRPLLPRKKNQLDQSFQKS